MDLNDLNGAQKSKLREWLLDAFNPQSFGILLSDNRDKNLAQLAGEKGAFTEVVFETIEVSQQEGWTDKLVEAAQRERPKKQSIKAILEQLESSGNVGADASPR